MDQLSGGHRFGPAYLTQRPSASSSRTSCPRRSRRPPNRSFAARHASSMGAQSMTMVGVAPGVSGATTRIRVSVVDGIMGTVSSLSCGVRSALGGSNGAGLGGADAKVSAHRPDRSHDGRGLDLLGTPVDLADDGVSRPGVAHDQLDAGAPLRGTVATHTEG